MKCSTFFSVTGILGIAFGLGFLLVPQVFGPLYAVPFETHTVMMSRYFGGSLLWVGLITWLARSVRDDAALRVLLQAGAVGNLVQLVISAWSPRWPSKCLGVELGRPRRPDVCRLCLSARFASTSRVTDHLM